MKFFFAKSPQKTILIVTAVTLIVLIRVAAPGIILNEVNGYLSDFSDNYTAHIEDLDLNFWRSAYSLQGVKVALKNNPDNPFFTATEVDVSIAWRALLQGKILTDVTVEQAFFEVDTQFVTAAKNNTKQSEVDAREAGSKLFPVEIERIEIKNSKVNYQELKVFIDHINGRISHYTATPRNPLSVLVAQGMLYGKAPIKFSGELNFLETPSAWVIAGELQRFKMPDGSSLINHYVPLTFKRGELDVYSEIKSEKGRLSGYIKPFLKDGEVMGDNKDFKGIKHFGIELTVAAVNLFFRSSQDHVLATKVLFTYEAGQFNWNLNETLTELFKNGYRQPLTPGIENLLTLKGKGSP